ncbi:MAG: hypothetical protein GY754_33190, partial [bacterium]|nr:hypothetical protein [bacterium]
MKKSVLLIISILAIVSILTSCFNVIGDGNKRKDTDILAFQIDTETESAVIDKKNHRVWIEIDYTADIEALAPTIIISEGAAISPASGEKRDFRDSAVDYTVIAENGKKQVWKISVTNNLPIKSFIFTASSNTELSADAAGTIESLQTIAVGIPAGTETSGLAAHFRTSAKSLTVEGVEQESGITINDFSSPVIYRATMEDSTVHECTVRIVFKYTCPEKTLSGPVEVNSRQDIEALLGVTVIEGDLTIELNDSDPVTDLSGLQCLTTVTGNLYIQKNEALKNLEGLNNLISVGGTLNIEGNPALENLEALSNLISVDESLYIHSNPALENLEGLSSLTVITSLLRISGNAILSNLKGLRNLTSLNGTLWINNNAMLTSLEGLKNLTSVNGGLYINSNPMLTSLEGLENFTSVNGNLWIYTNAMLTSLEGLRNITSVKEKLWINDNAILPSLAGLENIPACSDLEISNNAMLGSLKELRNLTPYRSVIINNNTILPNLEGLENITAVNGFLTITKNPA